MHKEATQFVFFDIGNKLLREICKDFKVQVEITEYHDCHSVNNIGFGGRRYSCYVHKHIANDLGTPGELGVANWFADMILYTKIGNKKAADFIKANAAEIDRHTRYYEIEYEHCDPDSSESCLLIEIFSYEKGNISR